MAGFLEVRKYNTLNSNPWDTTFGHNENCTLAYCNVETSIFTYRPSLVANAVFIALFGISLLIHVAQGIRWKTWFFTVAMGLGCVAEMVGYGGRIMMNANPFSFVGFMIQIVCITIAPVFYTAAIYVTLSKIIIFLGPTHSRFSPPLYYWIFIPSDLVSLILQATGGAMSASSSGAKQVGVGISLAGLSFQVFSLAIFIFLALEFAFHYWRSKRQEVLPSSFNSFVLLLSLAIVLILVRCIFRIDELSNGYTGSLIHNEGLFIALEGVMVIIATFTLNFAQSGLMLISLKSKG